MPQEGGQLFGEKPGQAFREKLHMALPLLRGRPVGFAHGLAFQINAMGMV